MAFWNRNKNRGREPTADKPNTSEQYKMVITWGEHYYSWNGKLYDSDIIRACIRPKVKAGSANGVCWIHRPGNCEGN